MNRSRADTLAGAAQARITLAGGMALGTAYALLILAWFSPVVAGSRILAWDDAVKHYLPSFTIGPVLWSSAAGGYPVYVDVQNMAFLPFKLLFQALGVLGLPLAAAYNLFVLLPFVIAATFTHLYVHQFTRSHAAATVGGLVCALSSPLLTFVEWPDHAYGAAMLPVLAVLLERLRERAGARTIVLLAVTTALLLLSGYPPMSNFVGLTAACYAVLRGTTAPVGSRHYFRAALAGAGLGVGLAAVQLVPTGIAFVGNVGAGWTLDEFNEHAYRPSDYVRLLFPFITGSARAFYGDASFGAAATILVYLGLAPLVLGAVGLANRRATAAPLLFWACAATYFLALALGNLTPVAYLTWLVPIVGVGHEWARLFVVVAFGLGVFAGHGTAVLLARSGPQRILTPVSCVVAVFVGTLGLLQVAPDLVEPVTRNDLRPEDWSYAPARNAAFGIPVVLLAAVVGLIALVRGGLLPARAGAVLVPVLVAVDLASFGYAHEWRTASPDADTLVRRPASLEPIRDALRASHQRIASYLGEYDGDRLVVERRHPDDRTGLRQEIGRFWGFDTLEYFGKWTTPEFDRLTEKLDAADLARGSRALDMLAVRFLLVHSPVEPDGAEPSHPSLAQRLLHQPDAWTPVRRIGPSQVFENRSAQPRAWAVSRAVAANDDEAREAILAGRLPDGAPFDPARVVLLGIEVPDVDGPDEAEPGTVRLLERESTRYRLQVRSAEPAWLVISDNHHPAWRATVNGEPVPILRANLILRAVRVPAGDSLVALRFVPWDFYAGAGITILSLLLSLWFAWNTRSG
ncbi:MAG: hypothetical protein FJW23_15995 [Acidimicrobiia bacterium]|nr:hypothetical protein [Acidimicrobiia bacterium]